MALKKPIRGIFFDLGWTLFYPPSGNWRFSEFARRYFPREIEARPEFQAAQRAGTEYLDSHHLMSSVEEEYDCFLHYFTLLARAVPDRGITEEDVKKIAEERTSLDHGHSRLFPDTLKTLEALKGKYRLGIISDTWPSIVPMLEHFDLLRYFDCATYSYTLGVYKPHPDMYRDALEKMGLPPEETVFVDDSATNLRGAEKMGIQPVLIQAKPDPDEPGDMEHISKISDLLKLL